jgi:hypothetical protein
MSIWEPSFHWPPPPPVGGGGASGGAGASGEWDPGNSCPGKDIPWEIILPWVAPYGGILRNDELWLNDERALVGIFYIDLQVIRGVGNLTYSGKDPEGKPIANYWGFEHKWEYYRLYNGVVLEGSFYTVDCVLPFNTPWYPYPTSGGSLYTDKVTDEWITWEAYASLYYGDDSYVQLCLSTCEFLLLGAFCSLPLPWGGGRRGKLGRKGMAAAATATLCHLRNAPGISAPGKGEI